MSKHSVIIISMLIFTAGPVSAQFETKVTGVGTTAASFLEIGVSARALGMGGAYTSVIDGPAALSYNPANIVWLQGTQVCLLYTSPSPRDS